VEGGGWRERRCKGRGGSGAHGQPRGRERGREGRTEGRTEGETDREGHTERETQREQRETHRESASRTGEEHAQVVGARRILVELKHRNDRSPTRHRVGVRSQRVLRERQPDRARRAGLHVVVHRRAGDAVEDRDVRGECAGARRLGAPDLSEPDCEEIGVEVLVEDAPVAQDLHGRVDLLLRIELRDREPLRIRRRHVRPALRCAEPSSAPASASASAAAAGRGVSRKAVTLDDPLRPVEDVEVGAGAHGALEALRGLRRVRHQQHAESIRKNERVRDSRRGRRCAGDDC
jgi:hypothetical protein